MKKWYAGLLVGAVALSGALLGPLVISSPAVAGVADTVCCYRWWGVSSALSTRNEVKRSPRTTEVDWARALVYSEAVNIGILVRIASNTLPAGGTSATGGGGSTWTTVNPAGTVLGRPYGSCYWTDYLYTPGLSLAMACEMKYRH